MSVPEPSQPRPLSTKEHAGYDPKEPSYYDRSRLDPELDRVFGVCHSCRLCFNLCGSFPAMFEAIDKQPKEVAGMTGQDDDRVVDQCYQCKMCFVKCPYTPPHEWQIDFPRLMLRAAATRVRERGAPLKARLLGDPEAIGTLGHLTWPFSNWANELSLHRRLFEKLAGVHREKKLPPFVEETFEQWLAARDAPRPREPQARVALFHTCYVNWNDPEIGKATMRVLERNRVDVACPPQRCCGMPLLDQGDVDGFLERARENTAALLPSVEQGRTIVVPQPTCGYVLKNEVPSMLGTEEARRVGAATMDVCELLAKLDAEKKLDRSFPPEGAQGDVSYHLPCHLQAQNIGYKSRDVMRLIPKTRVVLNDRCTAHDGTWAMKKEHFDDSMRLGKKCFSEVEDASPRVVASDCPLAAIQIQQGTGRKTYHPIQLVDAAYRGIRLESPVVESARYEPPPPPPAEDWQERLKDVKALTAEDVERFERGEESGAKKEGE